MRKKRQEGIVLKFENSDTIYTDTLYIKKYEEMILLRTVMISWESS